MKKERRAAHTTHVSVYVGVGVGVGARGCGGKTLCMTPSSVC